MACGKPVIATQTGGPDDFVKDFNGILIPSEDVEELTKAMCDMIENRSKYQPSVVSKYVNVNFSREAIASKLENVYISILKGNNHYCE
jgi:glycosyltransferase involved in cell wall biosynthesis